LKNYFSKFWESRSKIKVKMDEIKVFVTQKVYDEICENPNKRVKFIVKRRGSRNTCEQQEVTVRMSDMRRNNGNGNERNSDEINRSPDRNNGEGSNNGNENNEDMNDNESNGSSDENSEENSDNNGNAASISKEDSKSINNDGNMLQDVTGETGESSKRKRDEIEETGGNSKHEQNEDKRRRISKEDKRKIKINKLIEELKNPPEDGSEMMIEDDDREYGNDLNDLAKKYQEVLKEKAEGIMKWYRYGQSFTRKYEEMKQENNRRKGTDRKRDQDVKTELYEKVMEKLELIKENDNEEEKERKKNAFTIMTRRAIRLYEWSTEVGNERLRRIRETNVSFIVKLKDEEIDGIMRSFSKRWRNRE
jgi:hypothetical protein